MNIQATLLLPEIDPATRAHVTALAAALRRRAVDLREMELAFEGPSLERALEGADCALVLAGAQGVRAAVEQAMLRLRRRCGTAIARIEAAPEETAVLAATWPEHPAIALLPAYDVVGVLGGNPAHRELYRALGAPRVVSLGPALDARAFHPARPRSADVCDLLYLGARAPERDHAVERLLLEPAARLPKRRFAIAGAGWEDPGMPPNVVRLPSLSAVERNALYAAARFVLHAGEPDDAPAGPDGAGSIFEAAGAGACLIGEAGRGIERYLEPDEECLVARSGDDVVRALTFVTPARARELGRRARSRVLRDHTYDRRAEALLAAIEAVVARGPGFRELSASRRSATIAACEPKSFTGESPR